LVPCARVRGTVGHGASYSNTFTGSAVLRIVTALASLIVRVTCAMAVQDQMARRDGDGAPKIMFRIGINVGDIIIDSDDIFGDGVNIATRVENECQPGGVCLSDDAFRQVRGKTAFAFDDLGEKLLASFGSREFDGRREHRELLRGCLCQQRCGD